MVQKNTELFQQIEDGERELTVPKEQSGWLSYHPCFSTFEEFRDGIRRQFKLHDQGLKLQKVGLAYTDADALPESIWHYTSISNVKWEEYQKRFEHMSNDQYSFTFRATAATDEDDPEFAYESTKLEKQFRLGQAIDSDGQQDPIEPEVEADNDGQVV